jgi:hypothetical protein
VLSRQLQLFLYLLFDYNLTENIESESCCVCDAGKILWQLVNIIFTGRQPKLAIPRCYCLSAKACVHKRSFINTLISNSKETSCLPDGKLIVDLPMREVVSIRLPTKVSAKPYGFRYLLLILCSKR